MYARNQFFTTFPLLEFWALFGTLVIHITELLELPQVIQSYSFLAPRFCVPSQITVMLLEQPTDT